MPRGTQAQKEQKRRAVARGVVEGKPLSKIASEAGCKKRYAQKLSKEPETRFLITAMLAPQRDRLAKLSTKVISAVEAALKAKRTDKEDHIARLRAVERYGDLVEMAQGGESAADKQRDGFIDWDQFTALLVQRTRMKAEASGE